MTLQAIALTWSAGFKKTAKTSLENIGFFLSFVLLRYFVQLLQKRRNTHKPNLCTCVHVLHKNLGFGDFRVVVCRGRRRNIPGQLKCTRSATVFAHQTYYLAALSLSLPSPLLTFLKSMTWGRTLALEL